MQMASPLFGDLDRARMTAVARAIIGARMLMSSDGGPRFPRTFGNEGWPAGRRLWSITSRTRAKGGVFSLCTELSGGA